jgi:hypothetical protein
MWIVIMLVHKRPRAFKIQPPLEPHTTIFVEPRILDVPHFIKTFSDISSQAFFSQ